MRAARGHSTYGGEQDCGGASRLAGGNAIGAIMMVDPAINTVVIQTSGGVPFDMVVGRNTRIESGDRAITLQDLQRDMDKGVSVRFVPERRGDVARTIRLNG